MNTIIKQNVINNQVWPSSASNALQLKTRGSRLEFGRWISTHKTGLLDLLNPNLKF
jgi:hypothetical protein